MSVDPCGDLDRAHLNLRRAAELVVERWAASIAEFPIAAVWTDAAGVVHDVDLAGVGEAVTLLERELRTRPATRSA